MNRALSPVTRILWC